MRFFLFVSWSLLLVLPVCYGQNKFETGIESGYSISSLRGDQFRKSKEKIQGVDFATKLSVPFGLSFQYNFSDMFSLRTGVSIESKGSRIQFDNTTSEVSDFKYLTVPALLRFSYGGCVKVFADAGAFFGYLNKLTVTHHHYTYDSAFAVVFYKPVETDFTSTVKRSDIGFTSGLGLKADFCKRYSVSIEWRNSLGLADVNKDAADFTFYQYYKPGAVYTASTSFLVSAGVRFGERKVKPAP